MQLEGTIHPIFGHKRFQMMGRQVNASSVSTTKLYPIGMTLVDCFQTVCWQGDVYQKCRHWLPPAGIDPVIIQRHGSAVEDALPATRTNTVRGR